MGWLSDLIVRVKGDSTHLDGTLNKTKSSVGGWAKKVAGLFAAAFSVRILINFAKKAAQLFDIQAKAEQSLLVALKGREDIQKSIIKQAGDLQKVTLFGDEQTIEGAAKLAMLLGQDEDAIRRLLPLVQDLATAKFGGNLVTAADMVAKSVGSSTNALTRYGIEITGAVGSAERLETTIAALNKQVGGQSQAAALVGMGAMTQLKNAWGDLMEVVGKAILQSEKFQKILIGIKTTIEKITKKHTDSLDLLTKEQLAAEKERLEIERGTLELKGQTLIAENDALEGIKKYTKEARERRKEIQGAGEELLALDKQIEEINKHLAYIPPDGSTGDIIKGIKRVKGFTAPTGHLKPVSTVTAHGQVRGQEGEKTIGGIAGIQEFNTELTREMTKMEELLTSARDMAAELGFQMVEALGEALGGGEVKELGKGLLLSLANFLSQFGRLLLVMGLGMEAFVKSLESLNPWVAIAAGTAMLVAAGAIRGLLSSGGKSVSTGTASAPGSSYGSSYAAQGSMKTMTIKIEGELHGRDIYWSGKRYSEDYDNGT